MNGKSPEPRQQQLIQLACQINDCSACGLHAGRTHAVPGVGPYNARIMVIGEGPGEEEDAHGLPFVGEAGQILNELLNTAGLDRHRIFVTNIVKCRTPDRKPLTEEVDVCTKAYLERQIQLVDPILIITMGGHALRYFLPDPAPKIGQAHGQMYSWQGRMVYVMYHPSVALYSPHKMRAAIFSDFKKLGYKLEELREMYRQKKTPQ